MYLPVAELRRSFLPDVERNLAGGKRCHQGQYGEKAFQNWEVKLRVGMKISSSA